MIGLDRTLLEPGPHGLDRMGVVEADQPLPFRVVKRQRITQPVRPLRRRLNSLDLELHEIAFGIPVYVSIEAQEKFEGVLPTVSHIHIMT